MIRVLVCRVGADPKIEIVENPFAFARDSLLSGGSIESVTLETEVVIYADENGRQKSLPYNRPIPARMPVIDPVEFTIIKLTDHEEPAPGEMGVHHIYGNFLLTRHGEEDCVDLTDHDIWLYSRMLQLPRSP